MVAQNGPKKDPFWANFWPLRGPKMIIWKKGFSFFKNLIIFWEGFWSGEAETPPRSLSGSDRL